MIKPPTEMSPQLGDAEKSLLSQAHRKVCVALPAYNEELVIGDLIQKISDTFADNQRDYEIIVVDDGSSDRTADIAYAAAKELPVHVVEHEQNGGLDRALDTCLREAYKRCSIGDTIITMDADDTHPPKVIDKLLTAIDEGHDVVIASRYQPGSRVVGVPWSRIVLAKGANLLCWLLMPIRGVRDYTCGYRAYSFDALDQALNFYGDDFVTEQGFSCMVDVLLKIRRFNFVVGEVPLILRYDQKETPSRMKVASTTWKTLKLFLKRRLGGY